VTTTITRRQFLGRGAILCAAVAMPIRPAQAAIANLNDAINKAGRIRMLSQRMAKAYCQVGQNVLAAKSSRTLELSIKLFQEHLDELKAFAPSAEIGATYAELETIWRRYRKLLAGAPSLVNARLIAQINEDALRLAHQGTTQLESASGSSVGRLINISGRQRMLSQRMAKFYTFRQWGIGAPDMDEQAQIAQRDFLESMEVLTHAPENTDKIASELSLVQTQWIFFEQALNRQSIGDKDPTYAANVATTSERILEVMDRVTSLYAQLSSPAASASNRSARR
jgi:nitrate/nitrite-specific signal transduction histidine kinase